jgi:TrpR family trp operon transcriptional repressor
MQISDLINLIITTRDEKMIEDFFIGITTEKERHEILQRIEIILRLLRGEPHQRIAKELGVGVATVTRGSKELTYGRFGILKKLTSSNIAGA